MRHTLPILLLLALNEVLLRTDAYSIPHVDSVMHFGGGITLGVLISGSLSRIVAVGWMPAPGRPLLFVLIFSLVTTGAVFWEYFEWTVDKITGSRMQPSIGDTMKDLLLGQLGAVVYAFAAISATKRGPSVPRNAVGTQPAVAKHTG